MLRLALLLICIGTASMAREVTDDAGHHVEIPDAPQRVISLHDWTLTVMLHELNIPMAGSIYRMGPDGHPFMRGAGDLFGLGEQDIPLASIHGQIDAERIAALKPDLIIGNLGDVARQYDQLATIAPVLLFNAETNEAPMARYRRIARWFGKTDLFDTRMAALKAVARPATTCTWLVVNPSATDGTLTIARHYGALDLAARLMGWNLDKAADMIPEDHDRATLSPEVAGAIRPDVLITTYLSSRKETDDTAKAAFNTVVPGYLDFMKRQGSEIVALPREAFYPTSFAGTEKALAIFEDLHPAGCD